MCLHLKQLKLMNILKNLFIRIIVLNYIPINGI